MTVLWFLQRPEHSLGRPAVFVSLASCFVVVDICCCPPPIRLFFFLFVLSRLADTQHLDGGCIAENFFTWLSMLVNTCTHTHIQLHTQAYVRLQVCHRGFAALPLPPYVPSHTAGRSQFVFRYRSFIVIGWGFQCGAVPGSQLECPAVLYTVEVPESDIF